MWDTNSVGLFETNVGPSKSTLLYFINCHLGPVPCGESILKMIPF